MNVPSRRCILPLLLLPALAWSACCPRDPRVWWFEALPALAIILFLAWHRRPPLTPLSAGLLAFSAVLMLVGAHYTYAQMPWFDWLRDALSLQRNHYDRFGHFFQGAVCAILLREFFLRRGLLRRGWILPAVVAGLCLGIAAAWELVEWAAVAIAGGAPDVYLSFQGDPWDSQADMLMASTGAVLSLRALGRRHDRQLARLLSLTMRAGGD